MSRYVNDMLLVVSLNDGTAKDAAQALGRCAHSMGLVSSNCGGLLLCAGRARATTPGRAIVRYVSVVCEYLGPDEASTFCSALSLFIFSTSRSLFL